MGKINENVYIDVAEELLWITVSKYALFMSYGKIGIDAMALYIHYQFTARMQKTNSVWANDVYCRQGLEWGRDRFEKAKSLLLDLNIIEIIKTKKTDGTFGKSYTKVKTRKVELEPEDIDRLSVFPQADSPASGQTTTNALTNNINALTNKRNALGDKSPALFTLLTKEYFEHYEKLYMKKPLFEGKQRGIIKKIETRLKDHPDPVNEFKQKLGILENKYKAKKYNGFTIEICCSAWDELQPEKLNLLSDIK